MQIFTNIKTGLEYYNLLFFLIYLLEQQSPSNCIFIYYKIVHKVQIKKIKTSKHTWLSSKKVPTPIITLFYCSTMYVLMFF